MSDNKPSKIILASTSKIRSKILSDARVKFEVIAPEYDEDQEKKSLPTMKPRDLAVFLAKEKAMSISKKFPESYVIGCDQVCEFEKKEICKSKNHDEAFEQLRKFNGKIHFQNSALVVLLNEKVVFRSFNRVEMQMRKMTEGQIRRYVELDQPWGCAGSYRYESLGKHIFQRINGDYFSVLGLSIQTLLAFLHSKNLINLW